MTGPLILFLPDYGPSVGGGHVMRSLTLARALQRLGARCAFAVNDDTAALLAAFNDGEVEVWPQDAWRDHPAVAVLDNYGLTAADERALAARGVKVAAMDDIGRAHDCDLVIDPGLGRTAADYPGRAQVLAGPRYALLRPEFSATAPNRQGGRVLVSLGLTDVGGITAYVLAKLVLLEGWSAIDVVLGSGAESLEYVREAAVHDARITLHVETRAMARLSADADFAIGAGGGSVWERACLGLPTLLLILAENQRPMAHRLAEAGAALTVDVCAQDFEAAFDQALGRMLVDTDLRAALSAASRRLCDGKGAERVAHAILALAGESAPTP